MESVLPYITGSAGALVVLALVAWAFYIGKLHPDREYSKLEAENSLLKAENNQLRDSLATERRAVNDTAQAGQVNNQLLAALISVAREHGPPPPAVGLTAEDIGL